MKKIYRVMDENVKKILDTLTDGVIITDENSVIEYINPAYTMFSGLKEEEALGRHLTDVRPGAILPQVLKSRTPVMDVPRKVDKVESYCDFIPLLDQDELIGGMAIVKDVVRIKGLLKELQESNEKIVQLDQRIRKAFQAQITFKNIVGAANGLKSTVEMSKKAARTDSPVLLVGESGTGKEMIAQSIHNESERRDFPFVDVNCAALPEHLLESELFGYVEGAFTGAKKHGKLGLFEIANGGTIFLDEISEMPLNLQTKLLRTIQESKIQKIGDEKTRKIDVRVIAATNKDIASMVARKEFRDDLYFRLAVFVINIPSLRERRADIALLASYFVSELQRKKGKIVTINKNAAKTLEKYDWPGNVRELQNALEYAFNVTDSSIIDVGDLPQQIIKSGLINNIIGENVDKLGLEKLVEQVERKVLSEYLELYGESVEAKKKIAAELDVSIATLYNKIKKYNLP